MHVAFLTALSDTELPFAYDGAAAGILYVEDFDAPDAPALVAEAAPAPPAITPAELAAARAEGRAEGLAAALEDQAAVQAALQTAALTAIGDALTAARTDAARLAQDMAEEIAATLLALLQAALPAACETLARQEITGLVAALLPGLRHEPAAHIMVHPALQRELETKIKAMWRDHGGRLRVSADDTLAASDVRVQWEGGEARRDTGALWDAIRAALAPYHLPRLTDLMTDAAHG